MWAYVEADAHYAYPAWTTWDSYGSKSSAVYANAEYDITDDLTASVGLRRQEDSTKSFSYTSNGYGDEICLGCRLHSYAGQGAEMQATTPI